MAPPVVAIPVISRWKTSSNGPGRIPFGRKYSDGPLPTTLSDHAPKNAIITGRVADAKGTVYALRIGDVEINDVGVEEILDYVSPLYLEQYENAQFVEEREVLAAVEVERQALRREQLERQKERAKRKGVLGFEEIDSSEDVSGADSGDFAVHGRARPTYKHLFKVPEKRRRRKRDPQTGELVPLTDESDGGGRSSDDEADTAVYRAQTGGLSDDLPKRRRRKGDKVTGELLALSPLVKHTFTPSEKKRRRRRRHPMTGELMPLGWRYDPDRADQPRSYFQDSDAARALHKSDGVQGHEAKRPRLSSEGFQSTSSSPQPTHAGLVDRSIDATDEGGTGPQASKLQFLSGAATSTQSIVLSDDAEESSSEPELKTSITRPTAGWKVSVSPAPPSKTLPEQIPQLGGATSLLHPSASSDVEESLDDDEDDDWVVERIYEHRYSNPATHPTSFGRKPIMLYQTKWLGTEELTWEPLISFGDWNVVRAYRRRVGLPSEPSDAGLVPSDEGEEIVSPHASHESSHSASGDSSVASDIPDEIDDSQAADAEDVDEEDVFEVERIVSHRLSDPRTHPSQLGKTPVMLYEVKWKGWEDTTWEPAESFEATRLLEEYHGRVGSRPSNFHTGRVTTNLR